MNNQTLVRVTNLSLKNHPEIFVLVPNELYSNALKEKKLADTLEEYYGSFKANRTPDFNRLLSYIEERCNCRIDISIERINII